MSKPVSWILGILAGLIGLLAIVSGFVYFGSQSRINRVYDTNVPAVIVPDTQEAVERGRYLVTTVGGCVDCHGADLSGGVLIDDPMIGSFFGPNLTSGKGGVGQTYNDLDWARSIRHGIKPDGTPILVMPGIDYYNFSDDDLGAIIAYLKSLPPADNLVEASQAGPIGRALVVTGKANFISAELINHAQPRPGAPERAATPEYGKYLASIGCIGCHGAGMSGGAIPGAPKDQPVPENLTPSGDLGQWNEAQFIQTLRTGMTPSGRILDPQFMPWPNLIQMTDTDLGALWAYFHSLPSKEAGTR